jgi:transaldolase / glucose-6-phosphate isomerase
MQRAALRRGFHLSAGQLAGAVQAERGAAARAADGLWHKDPSVWSRDGPVQEQIANRLGWLSSPGLMDRAVDRMKASAEDVRQAGFEDVVLLGMGGSSLAPEVLRAVIGGQVGWPRLHMLDSTDPAAVRSIATNPARTLFLLASKSGTTIEPNSLAAHFRRVLETAGVANWASHFIAITDAGTALAERARTESFRDVFINPADIGGRYSALSFFGLVPAGLMGQDVGAIVRWGRAMIEEAQSPGPVDENPAVALGLLMAAGAKSGRDKLTLVVPPALEPFGLWVEQLVAESTGKQGVGVVPIAGETLGSRGVYGVDRIFVRLRSEDVDDEQRRDRAMDALGDVPVATLAFPEPAALGAEFARWEIATAIAGALLGINPFDEPNVQQAKDATRVLLGQYKSLGRLPSARADRARDGVQFTLTTAARAALADKDPESLLGLLGPGDYLSLLVYLAPEAALGDVLHHFRMSVRDVAKTATMFGYGPRYLHSTGQLHKGGPNSGLSILVTADPAIDVDIPGETFSFGTLERAQALGDFASLDAAGRRGLHIHLSESSSRRLQSVLAGLLQYLPRA